MTLEEIDTPALVVELPVLERNLERMALYCRQRGFRLRPHVKTHKIPEIARMQLALGAAGLTVAKTSEAEVMIREAGARDVLVAFPVVGEGKTRRLAALARQASIEVAVDGFEAAEGLARAARAEGVRFGLLLDLDVGYHRTGFASVEALAAAAERIRALEGVELRGVFCFPGQVMEAPADQAEPMAGIGARLRAARDALQALGVASPRVSSGSTPTAYQSHLAQVIDEVRPGTYVFNDSNYLAAGAHGPEDCALTVHATVVSAAVPGQVVIDGGSKTFSSDAAFSRDPAAGPSYGRVLDLPGARFFKCSEEHGWIDVSRCPRPPKVGDRLRVVPNHACPAVNLHDRVYGARGGRVEAFWRVAARGKVQ